MFGPSKCPDIGGGLIGDEDGDLPSMHVFQSLSQKPVCRFAVTTRE